MKLLLPLAFVLLAGLATAQTKSNSYSETKGNSSVHADRVISASAQVTSTSAQSHADLVVKGKLLNIAKDLAEVKVDAYSNGTNSGLKVKVGGATVYSKTFSGSGGSSSSPIQHLQVINQSWDVFSVGPASVKAKISAGAGAQHSATASLSVSQRKAQVSLAGQVYANAEGSLSAQVLFGAAGASITAGVNFFNTTANMNLKAAPGQVLQSSAVVHTILWQLYVKLKAWVLFVDWSKTIVQINGPTYDFTLL